MLIHKPIFWEVKCWFPQTGQSVCIYSYTETLIPHTPSTTYTSICVYMYTIHSMYFKKYLSYCTAILNDHFLNIVLFCVWHIAVHVRFLLILLIISEYNPSHIFLSKVSHQVQCCYWLDVLPVQALDSLPVYHCPLRMAEAQFSHGKCRLCETLTPEICHILRSCSYRKARWLPEGMGSIILSPFSYFSCSCCPALHSSTAIYIFLTDTSKWGNGQGAESGGQTHPMFRIPFPLTKGWL